MELDAYQAEALRSEQVPAIAGSELLLPLLGLAGEAGQLLSEYKKHMRDGDAHVLFPERVAEELGDILWYVASAAQKFGFGLDAIAEKNLRKIRDSWSGRHASRYPIGEPYRFDQEFPESERFPRKFSVFFEEFEEKGQVKVRGVTDYGRKLGDDLTDNAFAEDGYRFHDVFHLACVAVLGWSPVCRRNLGLKRRSNLQVDEVEDGGRATVIEEGITALVYSYATQHTWLSGVTAVDHDLIRTIKSMTAHLEVNRVTVGDWERTILSGYEIWREILLQRGGVVELDLDNRTIVVI